MACARDQHVHVISCDTGCPPFLSQLFRASRGLGGLGPAMHALQGVLLTRIKVRASAGPLLEAGLRCTRAAQL